MTPATPSRSPLRPPHWQVLLVFLLGVLLFLPPFADAHAPRSLKALWDAGHVVAFAFFTACALPLARRYCPAVAQRWLAVLLVALVLAAAAEAGQGLLGAGREVSSGDVLASLAGTLLALFWCDAHFRGRHGVAALLLLLVAAHPLAALTDDLLAWRAFPELIGSRHSLERLRWSGNADLHRHAGEASPCWQLELSPIHAYPGASFIPLMRDWRGHRGIRIEVVNPGPEALSLTLRINDIEHYARGSAVDDRFNRAYWLPPGRMRWDIPLDDVARTPGGRLMNLARIEHLEIFARALPAPASVRVCAITLY